MLNKKITLEDLLKAKRIEKASPKDWDDFDRSLNNKILKDFIDKDPINFRFFRFITNKLAPITASIAVCLLVGVFLYFNVLIVSDKNDIISYQAEILKENTNKSYQDIEISRDYKDKVVAEIFANNNTNFQTDSISISITSEIDYSSRAALINNRDSTNYPSKLVNYVF